MATPAPSSAYAPLETPTTELPPSSTAELPPLASTSSPQPPVPPPTTTTAEHVDLLFKRWTAAVAQKMRRKGKKGTRAGGDGEEDPPPLNKDEEVEVWRSVFEPWALEVGEGGEVDVKGKRKERAVERGVPEMNHERFLGLVEDVCLAISSDVHPKLNAKGSSGSYFALSPSPPHQTLGIFKPADEDPYAALNPKWLKWLHRNFLARLIPFGRSCLVPGQSYISEAAASTLDRMLGTDIVPRTEVVSLASPAFYYDWIDRERAARRGGKLREKEGSFQVFLKGFTDASDFLAKHPYPGRPVRPSSSKNSSPSPKHRHNRRRRIRGCLSCLLCLCGRAGAEKVLDEELGEAKEGDEGGEECDFEWTEEVVESLREGLECLVILDFLIRNTDRGLDNFMLKPCSSCEPPAALAAPLAPSPSQPSSSSSPPSVTPSRPHLHLAAIDNSLAFPHTHPSGWRRYPYGWLFLPLSLIGRPWSAATRERFLPKLSDPRWWSTLKREVRDEFKREASGKGGGKWREEVFEKQFALVKGQGLNLAASLRKEDEGPVELCRRPKKLVFDDYVLVPIDADQAALSSTTPRPNSPAPLSFGQAADTVLDTPSSPHRPALHEQQSAPSKLALSSPSRPSPSSSPTAKKSKHRRAVSSSSFDYSSIAARRSFPSPQSSPSRTRTGAQLSPVNAPILATTTRSPSVSVPISDAAPSSTEAAQLRKPLDALSASLDRPGGVFPSRGAKDAAADGGDEQAEGEEEELPEETGVSLMRRLDRVEETERKRLKRAEKDTAARAALDLDGEVDLAGGGASSLRVGKNRRTFSHGAGAAAGRGRAKPWRLFRRAVSEEHAPLDERSRLLGGGGEGSDALFEGEEAGEEQGDADERAVQSEIVVGPGGNGRGMSMSWYGGTLGGVTEGDEACEEEPERVEGRGKRRKWVVVERIEDVKEPKRHWWRWEW
ncbi:hypothetical protein JCM6882_005951 [Rhodosporidiobolus microsporus]